jgi:glycosyltransferase involved in cell wall biosynthesis
MNILWQNEHYPDIVKGGGGAINTYYIVRSLQTLGHQTLILAQSLKGEHMVEDRFRETTILRVQKPTMPSNLWPLWPFLDSFYLKTRVTDIGRAFDGFVCIDAGYALAIKRQFPERRMVYRVEGSSKSHLAAVPARPPERALLFHERKANAIQRMMIYLNDLADQLAWKKCDALVVKSQFMKHELVSLYNAGPEKIHVIPNGVDYARYASVAINSATMEQLGKNGARKVVIIYTGRLVRMKNVSFLLHAFARMRQKRLSCLVILGDGEERANLEREAQELGIAEDVRFLGHSDLVEQYLAAADIFVLPSTYEPFGNVLVEAMAAGLPTLALKPDGNRVRTASAEIIQDGCSGYLVDSADATELACRLDALATDANLRKELGKRGQEICRARFDWVKCAAEYVRLLTAATKPQSVLGATERAA